MQWLCGFNLIEFAITLFVVWVFGWELSTKDKLILIMYEAIFLGILSVGIYLLVNG